MSETPPPPTMEFNSTSCNVGNPLAKLQANGTPSELKYTLPHSTVYNAVAFVEIPLQPSQFNTFGVPAENYWNDSRIVGKTVDELVEQIDKDLGIIRGYEVNNRSFEVDRNNRGVNQTTMSYGNIPPPMIFNNDTLNTGQSTYLELSKRYIAEKVKEGFMPVIHEKLSGQTDVVFVPRPPETLTPRLIIALHLKMSTHLGDYGAGETVKTFSLLPGEKSTITIRHYQSSEETRKKSESVLEAYTESSANELQTTVEQEIQFMTNLNKSDTYAKTGTWNAGGSVGLNLGFLTIGGGGGGGGTTNTTSSLNSVLQTQVQALNSAVNHHTQRADASRKIEVNNETTSKVVTTTEEVIVRELENINKSRTLNFVYRQLLQEYITVTYLNDVSFIYHDGYDENRQVAKLPQVEELLNRVLAPNQADAVLLQIDRYLSSIYGFDGLQHCFIEKFEETSNNCYDTETSIIGWRRYRIKKRGLTQTFEGKSFPGIILDVEKRTLRTPSIIVESLLGQADALDCYNISLQQAAVHRANLENFKMQQAILIVGEQATPADKVTAFKKLFSDCCDVPQSGCGCGGNSENPAP